MIDLIELILLIVILVLLMMLRKSGTFVRVEQKHVYVPVKTQPKKPVRRRVIEEDNEDSEY